MDTDAVFYKRRDGTASAQAENFEKFFCFFHRSRPTVRRALAQQMGVSAPIFNAAFTPLLGYIAPP
jgi:hypothetical protein